MIGASLFLIKDISIAMQSAKPFSVVMYVVVFSLSTYLLYKQKVGPQWIALTCIVMGLLMSHWF